MAIPDRLDAARLLLELEPPEWFVAHVAGVAEVATFLAARASRRGVSCDRALVEAAALLHDVDKLFERTKRGPVEHGEAGARWLSDRGYGELAPAVAAHPVRRMSDDAWYASWTEHATLEERIVAYADKRVGQRLITLDARFAEWQRRYPEYEQSLRRTQRRAERLERDVCTAAGVGPESVRRLRWVRGALDDAADRSARRDVRERLAS